MRISLDFTDLVRAIPEIKLKLAEITKEHIKQKIMRGMAPALKRPRRDGSISTPLYHTGLHLHHSIDYQTSADGFEVGSSFIGARVLHNGNGFVPPRRYLEPDQELIDKWVLEIHSLLQK